MVFIDPSFQVNREMQFGGSAWRKVRTDCQMMSVFAEPMSVFAEPPPHGPVRATVPD
jgi:hypothetical protein